MKKTIHTDKAPAAIGPYSQGVLCSGNFLYDSGQLPIVPETGEFAGEDIVSQTHQSLKNIQAILEQAGMGLENVVSTTIYLSDIAHFQQMNEVYATYFKENCPARAAFQVAALPKNALVEIQAVACQ